MTVHFTDEMMELLNKINPWLDGCVLRKDAPEDIVEADKRFNYLYNKQYELELSLM